MERETTQTTTDSGEAAAERAGTGQEQEGIFVLRYVQGTPKNAPFNGEFRVGTLIQPER